MKKRGKAAIYISIAIIVIIAIAATTFFIIKNSNKSGSTISDFQRDLEEQFAGDPDDYGIKVHQILPIEEEQKGEALKMFCGSRNNCDDIASIVVSLESHSKCQRFTMVRLDGKWIHVDDNNLEDSYCE